MSRRVAADASTLIGLATAGQFELLQRVFSTVDVTGAVRDEVGARKSLPGAAELESAVDGGWVSIVPVEADPIFADLDAGEATTLTYAQAVSALVLTDDLAARSCAKANGLTVMGTCGVLIRAKRRGFVAEIRPLIERLQAGGFRLSNDIVHQLLAQAGEVATRPPP